MLPTARSQDLVVETLGDELVVFDTRANQAHTLNRAAALVWRHADGRTPVAGLAAAVAAATGADADAGGVELALDQLGRAGLLEGVAPAGRGLSRREAVRRLGLAGAAAALLPLVRTMAAPTAAMAASPSGVCDPSRGTRGAPCGTDEDCCPPLICIPTDPFDPTSPTACLADF